MRDEDAGVRPVADLRRVVHEIGGDLSRLSLDEIDERVDLLEGEIRRLKDAAARKTSSRDIAAAFFKTPDAS